MTPAEPPIDASERALSRSFGGLYDQWAVGRVPQAVLDRMSARADPRTGLLWWQQRRQQCSTEARESTRDSHQPPQRRRFFRRFIDTSSLLVICGNLIKTRHRLF